MGLFVSTIDFADGTTSYGRSTIAAMDLICQHFNVSTSPQRITSLALDHLTDKNGVYLDAPLRGIARYFGCFDHVYIGTADNHFAPDMYCTALLNTSYTGEWVTRSVVAAKRFADEHPALDFRWYLNYEAAGNYFGTGCDHFQPDFQRQQASPVVSARAFTQAYSTMFASLTLQLVSLRNASVMWSPTFNWPAREVADRAALLSNVTSLFRAVPLLREVANQDAMGKYSTYDIASRTFTYNLTCADTVYYQALLKEAAAATPRPAAVTVNMELFSRRTAPKQSTIVGDPAEHEQRKCCYAAHNLTIGPSWELTDWYRSTFREWDPDRAEAATLATRHALR